MTKDSENLVGVERMDVPQMIARSQWWSGWCVDNEIENRDIVRLRYLLNAVTAHLQDERDAVHEMHARELHHFEVEEENARLLSIIAAAREEAYAADQGDSFGPIFNILGRAFPASEGVGNE